MHHEADTNALKKQHGHNGYTCLGYIIAEVNALCLLTLFVASTKERVISIALFW